MGMTIEEAIRRIDEHNYIHQRKEPRAVYITEAFDTLIEVAKKYQKIQEIVTKWQNEPKMKFDTSYYNMAKIIKVVEDGNEN